MRCESTFTTNAYRNWKHIAEMNRGFSKHAASKEHLACYNICKEKIKRSEMCKEIALVVNTEAIERNRYYFATLIDVVVFLATHQLAFRGKIDTWESEDEGGKGLFSSLFSCNVRKDLRLLTIIKTIPRNAIYASPDMQNELIAAMSSVVTEGIKQEIGFSWYITKVDGTEDPTGVENISIIICFFNEHSLKVAERFLVLSSTDPNQRLA